MQIDLDDKVSPHFTWRELLYCPKWGVCVFPESEEQFINLQEMCIVLEMIRDILKSPLKVTSGLRPRKYNLEIGGSVNSYHMYGMAIDFIPTKVSVHKAKLALIEFLDDLNCRMEDNGRGGWIHIDTGNVGKSGRFFKP